MADESFPLDDTTLGLLLLAARNPVVIDPVERRDGLVSRRRMSGGDHMRNLRDHLGQEHNINRYDPNAAIEALVLEVQTLREGLARAAAMAAPV